MELTAAISALQSLEAGCHVVLKSDCEYLIRGMRYQADRWRRNGWRNSRGVILQDRLLWQQLIGLRKRHTVQWQWVRGHNGHPTQTIADELAYSEARRAWCESRVAA
jgi:ribonuclease HI